MLTTAEAFLVKVMRSSEGIDPEDDLFNPEYINVEYDDETFIEAMSDLCDAPADDDE